MNIVIHFNDTPEEEISVTITIGCVVQQRSKMIFVSEKLIAFNAPKNVGS